MSLTPALVGIITAVVAAIAGVIGAIITGFFGKTSARINASVARETLVNERLLALEKWKAEHEKKYTKLWAYCRELLDFIYKYKRADAPDPPPLPDDLT